jgi:Outer membrane protein beta-barrel domain
VSALLGLFVALPAAHAQGGPVNVYFGLGTATDSSSNRQIDTFNTGNPYTTPKMGGLFGNLGADFMFSKHLGVGADFDWRTIRAAYAELNYRTYFYNFDAVYELGKTKHFVPELRGGLGGVNVSYGFTSTACDALVGFTTNQFLESAHHFQVHMEAAARYYMTDHIFLRPAVEAHWVNNFSQFGSNWVPQYSLGIGYSFGSRE